MTIATWPGTLPQTPMYGNFDETPQNNLVTFQPDVGPAKFRRRSTASGAVANAKFEVNDTQRAALDTFFRTTLSDGSLPFTWNHPITGVSKTWSFQQPPTYSNQGFNFHYAQLQLLMLP